jgi:hypothetical protein
MNEKNMKLILGLDLSTTCVGITLYKYNEGTSPKNGEIILITGLVLKVHRKTKGVESLFLKKEIFREKLKEIKLLVENTYSKNIDMCIIEEPLLQSNNCHTAGVLLKFNGIVSSIIYDELGIVPEYISSYDSRYYAFPELVSVHVYNKKNEKRDKKELRKTINNNKIVLFGSYPFQIEKKQVILDKITEQFPNIEWVYNAKGEMLKSNFDGSDSLCCILGYLNKMKYNSEKLGIVCCEENENENSITYTTTFLSGEEAWSHTIKWDDNKNVVE